MPTGAQMNRFAPLILALVCACSNGTAQELKGVHECGPPPDADVARLADAVRAYGGLQAQMGHVRALCHDRASYLALVALPARDTSDDYGWRAALLGDSAGALHWHAISRGQSDSHLPELRLFAGGEEYLALLGIGDEGGSWGINTLRISDKRLVAAGILDVGVPDSESGNEQGATSEAEVFLSGSDWRVGFHRPVVLWPNQEKSRLLELGARGRLLFAPAHSEWEEVGN